MTRLPLLPELAAMPWPAKQALARRLNCHPAQLPSRIAIEHAAAIHAAWQATHHQPTTHNRETELDTCPACGHPTHKETRCHTCRALSSRATSPNPS